MSKVIELSRPVKPVPSKRVCQPHFGRFCASCQTFWPTDQTSGRCSDEQFNDHARREGGTA